MYDAAAGGNLAAVRSLVEEQGRHVNAKNEVIQLSMS